MIYICHPLPPCLYPVPQPISSKMGRREEKNHAFFKSDTQFVAASESYHRNALFDQVKFHLLLLMSFSKLVQHACNRNKKKQKWTDPPACQVKKMDWFYTLEISSWLEGPFFYILFLKILVLFKLREVWDWINIEHDSIHDNESR